MTFWTFILLVIAVSLGVSRGLKFHEDPNAFDNLMDLIGAIIKWLLIVGLGLGLIGLALYGIYKGYNWITDINWDVKIDVPEWVGGVFCAIFLIGIFTIPHIIDIKNKGGLKKWYKYHKEQKKKNRQAKKDKIAKMTVEELKEYKKSKRPGLRFRILIAFPCLILLGFVYALIMSLINYK